MFDRLSRRRYVVGTGAALAFGTIAGCSGDGGDDSDGSGAGGGSDGSGAGGGSDGSGAGGGSDGSGAGGDSDGSGAGGDDGAVLDDVPTEIDEYLTAARGYEGTITDATGRDEVTVSVGAGGDGLVFDPPAIRIDSTTTVVWEWTGEGGAHNVASAEGSDADFGSGSAVSEEGATYDRSFDDAGVQLYHCTPHHGIGMLGAIEVLEG